MPRVLAASSQNTENRCSTEYCHQKTSRKKPVIKLSFRLYHMCSRGNVSKYSKKIFCKFTSRLLILIPIIRHDRKWSFDVNCNEITVLNLYHEMTYQMNLISRLKVFAFQPNYLVVLFCSYKT